MSKSTDDAAPQAAATEDWLGYGAYADALWARVIKALNKDNASGKPLGDDPLVVGLFGEWGAGKSHLLKLMYERAQEQSARDIADRVFAAPSARRFTVTVPVMFQPWKYEHEAHLHVPIAAHVRDALNDAWEKLPTDFEYVKKLAGKLAETAEETEKKISLGKTWFKKFQDGVAVVRGAADSDAVGFLTAAVDAVALCVGAPLGVSAMRRALIKSDEAADAAADADDASDPKAGKDKSDAKATETSKRATQAELDATTFGHRSDGFGFYRVDKLLRALTRPTRNRKVLATAGMKIGKEIEFDLGINFVVFVDDLDRCLPEKAVQMLELIKTVFNVESFAFVLALDDEVIERGIGHRYQAYHFAGKKPEMPITGFEYLEKIVHVPFRLPALTRYQAEAFLRRHETDVIGAKPEDCWFAVARPIHRSRYFPRDDAPDDMRSEHIKFHRVDLLAIALSGFDAFVPRKLVRMVELVHQMSDIAARRGRPLHGDLGSDVDIRIVLALGLIQLFQPELYRIFRRRVESFPSLLTAFIGEFNPDKQAFIAPASVDAHLSNIDLWRWAIDAGTLTESSAKNMISESLSAVVSAALPGMEPAVRTLIPPVPTFDWSPSTSQTEFHYCIAQIAVRHAKDRTARANAQLVRLPIVAQIVEHRAAQRHVFDVLKLMRALADSFATFAPSGRALKFAPYLSLLAEPSPAQVVNVEGIAVGEVGTAELTVAEGERMRVDVASLADDLLSRESAAQVNLATRHSLSVDAKIGSESLKHLAVELKLRLDKFSKDGVNDFEALRTEQRRLLTGLQFLAPFVAPTEGGPLWALVRGGVGDGDPSTYRKPIEPKLRALWGDVRSALGCDDRFDPDNFYLLKDRFAGHDETVEPIPGFVRVPFKNEGRDAPFYICRTLVTVDQFTLFVDAKSRGYDHPDFWDASGQLWR